MRDWRQDGVPYTAQPRKDVGFGHGGDLGHPQVGFQAHKEALDRRAER
jgi:hypothetical protein